MFVQIRLLYMFIFLCDIQQLIRLHEYAHVGRCIRINHVLTDNTKAHRYRLE